MAVYSSSNFKRNGAQHLKDNCNLVALVVDPVQSDNYATAFAKVIASTAYTSSDVTLADVGNNLTITTNPKSDIDPSGVAADTDDIAVCYFDTVAQEAILVQDVVDREILNGAGDTVNIPAGVITINNLVSV
ncbi:MAG: hypothetical protein GY829_04425 [Gammaproteobacteria bacterium]|nr:hypothetical protein [Gammaproteobacteria bacterium]MCP4881129.1 hypothetical protein [Gammaproteobacteria bacterium]